MKIDLPLYGAKQHREPYIAGIDLGTTNSLIAVMQDGSPRVIAGAGGEVLLPSITGFPPGAEPLAGSGVMKAGLDPSRVIYSIKRLMGRAPSEVEEDRRTLPYEIAPDQGYGLRIQIDGRLWSPPEISALILRELRRRAEEFLGEPVTRAVITVPAYFNDSQRQATRDAGRIAGLDVLRILNEPTAACLAYGIQDRREGTAAIYDLGGGTFDISILKLTGGVFEVLATSGNTRLGGDDLDAAVARFTAERLELQPSTDLEREELRLAVRRAREQLSEHDETAIAVTLQGCRAEYRLTRSEMEAAIEPLIEQTLAPCRQALRDAGLKPEDVDEVVLVGGVTRTPLVRRRVEELFGRPPACRIDPDQVVALGAAVQAGILAGSVHDLLLLDVIPLSLGIETYGGVMERIIPRNSTIPTAARQTFTTSVDSQTAITIHVLQGERELVEDNRSLARFDIEIEPMPAGWPRLEVTFLVDENGILSVTAVEQRTGAEATIEVRPSYGLTDEQVEQMILSSFEHAEADLTRRRLVELTVEAEQNLQAVRKQLPDAEEFAAGGELTRDELEEIMQAVTSLEQAVRREKPEEIREQTLRLDAATQKLAQLVMNREVAHALTGRKVEAVTPGSRRG